MTPDQRCFHDELRRARNDDTDGYIDVWYCPEPNCDFEINRGSQGAGETTPVTEPVCRPASLTSNPVDAITQRHKRISRLLQITPGTVLGPMDSDAAHADRGTLLAFWIGDKLTGGSDVCHTCHAHCVVIGDKDAEIERLTRERDEALETLSIALPGPRPWPTEGIEAKLRIYRNMAKDRSPVETPVERHRWREIAEFWRNDERCRWWCWACNDFHINVC